LKEWTTPDCRNTPSTTNLEEGEIVAMRRCRESSKGPKSMEEDDDDDDDDDIIIIMLKYCSFYSEIK